MGKVLKFRHKIIDDNPPASYLDICLVCDLNKDGKDDIIIGGKEGPVNLFWYENPSWKLHKMAVAPNLEAGGVIVDIDKDGKSDIVAGQQIGGKELFWFKHPSDPTKQWEKYIIENRFEKYHDQAAGDVDNDGEIEIVVLCQKSRLLCYYDVPENPCVSPWPHEYCHVIAEDIEAEGLVVTDIDNDGKMEIIAGTNIFKLKGSKWSKEEIPCDFQKTRVVVADLNNDGKMEIVLSEGESYPARLAWLSQPSWKINLLHSELFHPHSLQVADFNGDGLLDIFVGEMGLGKNPNPKLIIYLNEGDGEFKEVIIDEGNPTHEAKVIYLNGCSLPSIVGKPYYPKSQIDIWINEVEKDGL